jgi:hypothetical protein
MAVNLLDAGGKNDQVIIPAPLASLFSVDKALTDIFQPPFFTLSGASGGVLMIHQDGLATTPPLSGWLLRRSPATRNGLAVITSAVGFGRCVVWLDTFGQRNLQAYMGVASMAAWLTAAAGCSNAIPLQTWEGALTVAPAPTPSVGIYASVNDLARMTYADHKGNRTEIYIPAPPLSMFMQDRKTVDPANANVLTLTTDVVAEIIVPSSGLPVQQFIMGYLVRTQTEGVV